MCPSSASPSSVSALCGPAVPLSPLPSPIDCCVPLSVAVRAGVLRTTALHAVIVIVRDAVENAFAIPLAIALAKAFNSRHLVGNADRAFRQ